MAARTRERIVHFYEIADAGAPTPSRLPHRDWGARIRSLCSRPPTQRTVHAGEDILIGAVDPHQTAPHLLLAKVRQDVPQLIDHVDGTLSHLQLAADKELVDVTTVYFLPFGNVVATMAGGISAPRAQALKRWLGGMRAAAPDVRDIGLRPVVNARSREKLAHAAAIERVSVKIAPEPYDSPSALRASSDLGTALSRLHEDNPDMVITLTLEVPKKSGSLSPRRRARGHQQLLDSTRTFANDIEDWLDNSDAVDTAAARARMEAWHSQADDEKIDFVSERITAKCVVPFSSGDGHAIDLQVALAELERVCHDNERELRAAVSADL
ncbi:hypothetical protein ACIBWG_18300 [Streptomyces griseoaurantiacus]|uniref:hypothetical protein n=1 Tax=Streptomyces TaxID=1883 RepID=UPI0029B68A9F|nr:hypothetical protein [Streptomyces sp. ME02-6978.2a]MDX3361605.1 hypothetical protein [Streptomyces sp. ME02-6978.2a]WTI28334.1 hypothetical protein OHA67_19455 [Streptomyces jietaisiensis]